MFGVCVATVFSQEMMSLDSASHDPNERSRRCRVYANICIGAGLEGGGEHFLFTERTEQDERFVGPAARKSFGKLQAVDLARLVRGEHGVVSFVAQPRKSVGDAVRFFDPYLHGTIVGESFRQPSAGTVRAGDEEKSQTGRKRSRRNDCGRRAMVGERRAHAGNDGARAPLVIVN